MSFLAEHAVDVSEKPTTNMFDDDLIFDRGESLWMADYLATPLARIKVDETNCFGMVGWTAVRNSASGLPEHVGAAQSPSEQEGVEQETWNGPERLGPVCGGCGSTAERGRATFSRHIPWVVAKHETLKPCEWNRTKCNNFKNYSVTALRCSQEQRFGGFLEAANAHIGAERHRHIWYVPNLDNADPEWHVAHSHPGYSRGAAREHHLGNGGGPTRVCR